MRRSILECCIDDHRNDVAILSAWLANKTPETVRCWFGSHANYSIVAVSSGVVSGVAIMTRQGKIVLCYVSPEARFGGTGKALLQALECRAKEWGVLQLQVNSTLTAKGFYAHNGFVEGAVARTAFGTDGILFSKRLAASYPQKAPCRCSLAQTD
ncbi:GNAT family N-acetyltransferase [Noviherbaspirillum saxi]|uniref:GNAT family N-acetyltransferase n=1 Tax=Noviherbaspirillum saxi TaxID=2320863 RepID=A0A3A3FL31_9BURK|nr:GNAT family N-acetyltransferase [Noviherbaspirillum saxi]